MKRRIDVKVLPDSRVRIHWFMRCDGPIRNPGGILESNLGPITVPPSSGQIACMPKLRDAGPKVKDGWTHLTHCSDDPRAATCPDCQATAAYKEAMARLEGKQEAATVQEAKL